MTCLTASDEVQKENGMLPDDLPLLEWGLDVPNS